ncbi:MAG: DNA-protecting protein DprA [Oligoflexia bacterium]|nr:DNA-protecting protein DprA [Oligoflexia bacterium]
MQVFWFSNRCPHFSATDAQKYLNEAGLNDIKLEALISLGFFKAALWLKKHKIQWLEFIQKLDDELNLIKKNNGQIIFWDSPKYPQRLRNIYYPPAVLILKGDLSSLNKNSIAVVGAREPTDMGRQWVKKNIPELVKNNFIIASGGARGIDLEAHKSCVVSGGQSICFLPSGLNNPYPKSNNYLFDAILDKQGLLATEFISTDEVRRNNFHQRNRLIAGISKAVIIVEAALKSGTLMTANKATDDNNLVCVVPGSPLVDNYAGSLEILYHGGDLVRNSKDIIEKVERLT